MRTRIQTKVNVNDVISEQKRRSNVWKIAIKSKVEEFGVSWAEAKAKLNAEVKWACMTREMQAI